MMLISRLNSCVGRHYHRNDARVYRLFGFDKSIQLYTTERHLSSSRTIFFREFFPKLRGNDVTESLSEAVPIGYVEFETNENS